MPLLQHNLQHEQFYQPQSQYFARILYHKALLDGRPRTTESWMVDHFAKPSTFVRRWGRNVLLRAPIIDSET